MGITTKDFFENIYKVIFEPKSFFGAMDDKVSIRVAIGTLLLVTIINKIAIGISNGSIIELKFMFFLILGIIGTLILWFITGLFFEYVSKIFNNENKLDKILFYTAFAPIPYIFFAPLNLIKNIGSLGYILASTLEIFIYFWIIILYVCSLRAVYKISYARSFMLIFLPFAGFFFAIYWAIGFVTRIWYILSI